MLIPHSERNVFNFRINLLVMIVGAVIISSVLGVFVYLSSIHIGTTAVVDTQSERIDQRRNDLDATITEIRNVLRVARSFDDELVETLNSLGLEQDETSPGGGSSRGDLAEFFDLQVVAEDRAREIQDLRNLGESLGETVEPLREIRRILQSQEALLTDMPNLWPIRDGRGRLVTEFGPNLHPITGKWYLHQGISIAGTPGLSVVASANGRVVEMGYDSEYGLYVFLRHKYGFRTRYTHLQSISVTEGQDLVQGQQLGTLGSTGVVSRPHLQFIVKIGTDVVDPAAFLNTGNRLAQYDRSERGIY